ncbi:uncharacterized protein TNCV_752441 [Trichonephila clavipes]|uniref:Uncharacterized protein n=1 Tax=Trichonephila clavipes TaxID=2585209 RepID=A0A8X6WAA0_TRICX|nr:uncharacterized protein TNCV_752441 [Trichonephila clavipes]
METFLQIEPFCRVQKTFLIKEFFSLPIRSSTGWIFIGGEIAFRFCDDPHMHTNLNSAIRTWRSEIGGEREDDIEEIIMGHEDEMTIELQEILNEEHPKTQRNVSPSEQEEDERGPMPTSTIKDLLKKWEAVRAMILEWDPNQAYVSRVRDLYNNNTINYFRKILKKREKQSTLDMFFNAP